jgi:hypothetical protein
MHQVQATSAKLKDLFDPMQSNSPALWAVLKGNHTGTALVDHPQRPQQAVVRTDAVLIFFSQDIQQEFLNNAIA